MRPAVQALTTGAVRACRAKTLSPAKFSGRSVNLDRPFILMKLGIADGDGVLGLAVRSV